MVKPALTIDISEDILRGALRQSGTRVLFCFVAKPNSKSIKLEKTNDGQALLRIDAPAVDGKANERIIEVVAKSLGIQKRRLEFSRGETNPIKEICIHDITIDVIMNRWMNRSKP